MTAGWSDFEVELTVRDYFDMLVEELNGRGYSKAEHRRGLLARLGDRSEQAIERKHMNISAVLLAIGFPAVIDGYKPLGNFQRALVHEVRRQLEERPEILLLVEGVVASPVSQASIGSILDRLVEVPRPHRERRAMRVREGEGLQRLDVDYVAREAQLRDLGTAGEEFVVEFERARLRAAGERRLAAQVEHVARTRGDGLGYDVLSFDARDGAERLIEVKTTKFSRHTPFYLSRQEVRASTRYAPQYALYRVFGYHTDPGLFMLLGDVSRHCLLEPTNFEARLRTAHSDTRP